MQLNKDSSDNIYLNVSVVNTNPSVAQPTQAIYNVTYDQNLLDRPSDYYMAIAAFQIPLGELPLFIMPIVPDQPDPNQSSFIVGVCQQQNANSPPTLPPNGVANPAALNYPVNVTYWTEIEDITGQPSNALYYYVYNYEHLSDMFNYALRQSWLNAGSPGGACPYFFYNQNNGLYQLVMPVAFVNAAAAAGFHWTVFFNYRASYPVLSFYTVENNSREEIWVPPSSYDASLIAPAPIGNGTNTGAGAAYLFSQEFTTVDYINSVRKLVMTSASMPLQKEYYPGPNNVNIATANSVGIITDFNLDLTTPGAQRSVALYSPQIYRLIDLLSDAPLRKIDIAFWWVDRLNNFYPLYISPYDAITMKIGFFNKRLYRNQTLALK
jgi:hypothetical protein